MTTGPAAFTAPLFCTRAARHGDGGVGGVEQLLAAMGRANRINFPVNGLWSMSTEDAVCMEIPP